MYRTCDTFGGSVPPTLYTLYLGTVGPDSDEYTASFWDKTKKLCYAIDFPSQKIPRGVQS